MNLQIWTDLEHKEMPNLIDHAMGQYQKIIS